MSDLPATTSTPAGQSIGEVLSLLAEEFPELTSSKIRFLEDQGLITPDRTGAGYRSFTLAHVERLRFILRAQRDQYLPLRVIRDQLDALDKAAPLRATGMRVDPSKGRIGAEISSSAPRRAQLGQELTAADVAVEAGVPLRIVQQAQDYGLIAASAGNTFPVSVVDVVRAVGQLEEFGVESRHLRAFRAAAQREIGLVEQIVAPLRHLRVGQSQTYAKDTGHEVAGLCLSLHAALLRAALERAQW